jgi:hypothetical protein
VKRSSQGDGDGVVGDVQAQARAPLTHFGGEKWIKNSGHHLFWNAFAIVRKTHHHIPRGCGLNLYADMPMVTPIKSMHQGVVHQVGDNLHQRAGVAVHGHILCNEGLHPVGGPVQGRFEHEQNSSDLLFYRKAAAGVRCLVNGQLFEASHQLCAAAQTAVGNVGGGVNGDEEIVKRLALQALCGHILSESKQFITQGGDGHQAIANGRVEFVCNTGHQRAKRGQLLAAYQLVFGHPELLERGTEGPCWPRPDHGSGRPPFLPDVY